MSPVCCVQTAPKVKATAMVGLNQEPKKLDLKFGPHIPRFPKGGLDDSGDSMACTSTTNNG